MKNYTQIAALLAVSFSQWKTKERYEELDEHAQDYNQDEDWKRLELRATTQQPIYEIGKDNVDSIALIEFSNSPGPHYVLIVRGEHELVFPAADAEAFVLKTS